MTDNRNTFILARKFKAIQYKKCKCELCGLDVFKNYWCADFHHKNPLEKDFNVMCSVKMKDWNKLKNELDKCSLLCVSCHRKIHGERHIKDIKKALKLLDTFDIEKLPKRRATEKEISHAKSLFNQGHTYDYISKETKFSITSIKRWCPRNLPTANWSDKQTVNKVIEMYNNHIAIDKIGEKIKCDYITLRKRINKLINDGLLIERVRQHNNKALKNPRNVSINGVIYKNLKEASNFLNIKYPTLQKRIQSKNILFKNYFYVDSPKT